MSIKELKNKYGNTTNLSNNTSFQDLSEGILFSTVHSTHPDMSTDGDDLLGVWENSAGSVRQMRFFYPIAR
ncbi:MAG TPA: hypothetical protein VFS97_11790 [Nitrososphaeraceae archaeon]|nr:hypothetical protein [Nitrososphaeraceae archaeon]